ncbi:MAG TPA: heavy metal-binding domain-containing protein [Patescibacteria group bacterium]|nr:heavy metal-binding domain-containing protein [Patescibacteria group bacterium]
MKYICPMHPEVVSDKPGKCPKCGMKLVLRSSIKERSIISDTDSNSNDYSPLIIIIGLILLVSIVISYPITNIQKPITNFMVGFFLVFSGFKLINLKGFAEGYSMYDLLAKKVFIYGYVYPFIELFFALAMILNFLPKQILMAEITVMSFSGIGVLLKILKHEKFQCVCLGTVLKVPLTYVTLVEDFGMAMLAIFLLLLH